MSREIEVWGDWEELGGPALMGHLMTPDSWLASD